MGLTPLLYREKEKEEGTNKTLPFRRFFVFQGFHLTVHLATHAANCGVRSLGLFITLNT